MSGKAAPWVRMRGMGRILAQETNVSDLVQFLSDRDPAPWAKLIGFVPEDVAREAKTAHNADLLLTTGSRTAVAEVKLGHLMSDGQQEKYECLPSRPDLYLCGLSSDQVQLEPNAGRWHFLSLSEVIGSWEQSGDELARLLAAEAAAVLRSWDSRISGVFSDRASQLWEPMSVLDQKFLAKVVTRRIAHRLRERGRLAGAGVTSGGGLPIVQAWTPVRGEGTDRAFMAEIRWRESKPGGELRFGVDFDPRPGCAENEDVRRAAYDLAHAMDADIEYASLRCHLAVERPQLAELVRRDKPSRPKAKGDWERVIVHGFDRAALPDGRKNNRRRTSPDFYGDGALRFQAIAEIDFERTSAVDAGPRLTRRLSPPSSPRAH